MSEKIGYCTNYEHCSHAYKNEPVRIADASEAICPECGQPLSQQPGGAADLKSAGKLLGTVIGIAAFGALLIGVYLLTRSLQQTADPESPSPTPSPEVRRAEAVHPVASPANTTGSTTVDTPVPVAKPASGPPNMPVAVPKIAATADQGVKRDVLARIDAVPSLAPPEKDKLYAQVNRARALMKVVTIPFDSGSTSLNQAQAEALCQELQNDEIQRLVDNPTVVFVLLGFADRAGDPAKNLEISRQRAVSVQRTLQTTCGLANITHPVGMGGSEMFGAENRGKNRVAEVWAVLP